jgi:hypothetical protein
MMMKYALCGIMLSAFVTPALAANEFFVVQDITTMGCFIAEQKPTDVTLKVIGPVYDTQAKAAVAIKFNKTCETN